MYADGLLNGNGEENRRFFRFLAVSFAAHILLLLALIFARVDAPVRRIMPGGVINVDLVSAKAPSGAGAPPVKKVAPQVQKKKKPKASVTKKAPTPKKKVSVPDSKKKIIGKKKTSLKKKTFQPEKVVDNAIAEMEKKVEQSAARDYQKTMERLAEQVKKRGMGQGEGQSADGAGGVGTAGARFQTSELLSVYAAEIYSRISKNWSYNEQLAHGNGNLVALLGIRIMADGEIRDVWFDRKSGDRYFDEQARKAVLKTGYLPPLPGGLNKKVLEIGLRFTPEGLQ